MSEARINPETGEIDVALKVDPGEGVLGGICHDGTESRAKTIQIDSDGWVQAFPIEKGSAACKRS